MDEKQYTEIKSELTQIKLMIAEQNRDIHRLMNRVSVLQDNTESIMGRLKMDIAPAMTYKDLTPEEVYKLRYSRGMSLNKTAQRLGTSKSTVQRMCRKYIEQTKQEVKTMQDRDFSKYYVSEDDGMIWLSSSKEWDGTTPVFPTQEAFIDALAQCSDEHSDLNYIEEYKNKMRAWAETIRIEYMDKTEEEINEAVIKYYNTNNADDDDDEDEEYLDMESDLLDMLYMYQEYLMISKKDMNVYNEIIDWYIREEPNELTDKIYDFIDKTADKKYWFMEIGEKTLGHEVTKLMLTDEEKADFEYAINNNDSISEKQQTLQFIASIRLARKLINEE